MSFLESTVQPAQGLHFTISDRVPQAVLVNSCTFYVLHRFPKDVFVDPYELEQRSQDRVGPPFKVWGETDLELPVSSVSEGSLVLLGPVKPGAEVELPFHARYPLPSWTESHSAVTLEEPSLLTVCPRTGTNKKDEQTLFHPYPSPFDPSSFSIAVQTSPSTGLSVQIPTGNQNHLAFVEPMTIIVVFVATAYIARSLWKASLRFGTEPKDKYE